jgi:transcriptional regulator with XRE-family HTH domain
MVEMPRGKENAILRCVASNFSRLLDERSVSIWELATKTSVTHAIISRLLNERREPALPTLVKLCDAVGMDIVEVISEAPKRTRAKATA